MTNQHSSWLASRVIPGMVVLACTLIAPSSDTAIGAVPKPPADHLLLRLAVNRGGVFEVSGSAWVETLEVTSHPYGLTGHHLLVQEEGVDPSTPLKDIVLWYYASFARSDSGEPCHIALRRDADSGQVDLDRLQLLLSDWASSQALSESGWQSLNPLILHGQVYPPADTLPSNRPGGFRVAVSLVPVPEVSTFKEWAEIRNSESLHWEQYVGDASDVGDWARLDNEVPELRERLATDLSWLAELPSALAFEVTAELPDFTSWGQMSANQTLCWADWKERSETYGVVLPFLRGDYLPAPVEEAAELTGVSNDLN